MISFKAEQLSVRFASTKLLGVHSATDQIYNIKSSGTWLHILASTVVQFRNRMKGLGWSVRIFGACNKEEN